MLPPQAAEVPKLVAQAKALQAAGDHDAVRDVYRRILLVQPQAAAVWFQLGQAERACGDRAQAETALRKALALAPRERAVWQALHGVLQGSAARRLEAEAKRAKIPLGTLAELQPIKALLKKGDFPAAEKAALEAVKSAPEAVWPALLLGQARAEQGHWSAALSPLKVAWERAPEMPEAQLAYGTCLARLAQPRWAAAVLSPLASQRWDARLPLARLQADSLDLEAARSLLTTDLPKGSKPAEAMVLLAEVEARLGVEEAAFAALKHARLTGPHARRALRNLARIFREVGAPAASVRALQAGLQVDPGAASLKTDLAQSLQSDGAGQEASALLRDVIASDPAHAEAYRALIAAEKLPQDDPIGQALEQQLDRPGPAKVDRAALLFAAAKLAEDHGATDRAFGHLRHANDLISQVFPYAFEHDVAEARRLVADWGHLSGIAPQGPDAPVLFVTGLPRSGTTLVETILAAHPQVAAGGEMPFLSRALAPAMEGLRNDRPDPADFAAAGRRYLAAAERRTGATLFTDKAISTFTRIGHTRLALPNARFIVLRRDPRDVGLSMYRNMFPPGLHRYTTDLADMGRYIRLHDALVRFWAEALPDAVHFVDYEALTAAPEPNIRALVEFAGLPWDDACLAPEKSQRRVETLSFSQVRAPIGRRSVAGWRAHQADLAPLLQALERTHIDLSTPA